MAPHFSPGLGFVRPRDLLPEGFQEKREVSEYADDASTLLLVGRRKDESRGWELLPNRSRVDTVFVHQPHEKHLAWIGRMGGLKRLGILNPKTGNFSALAPLERLEALFIEDAATLASLSFLAPLARLRALSILDAKRLSDLSGLEAVPRLEELALQCGIWNPFKVSTFKPLAALTSLRCLRLTAEAKDKSLMPLKGLSKLQELELNLLQPFEEIAKLSAYFPQAVCKYFAEPYETFNGGCRKDKSHVGIHVAKGRRDFCRDCHPEKLTDYLAEFEQIRAETKRSGTW